MNLPWYLLFPLVAAIGYAIASLLLKKALVEGAHPMACFHVNNWTSTLAFLPLAFFETQPVSWQEWYVPVGLGAVFFIGGWFTFIAMQRGDVSLVTPVLGSKVVFVALGASLIIADSMKPLMWVAAIITTGGIFMMSATDFKTPKGARLAGPVVMALISAALYAFADVFLQKWAPSFGPKTFLAILAGTTGVLSLLSMTLLPNRPPIPWNRATQWSLGGSVLIAAQSITLGLSLAYFNDAVGVNVVYATRGMWSLAVVALLGPLLGNRERHESGKAYGIRIAAALLLMAGVVCAVISRMQTP
ncbi:MAG: DMT family transporter [Prosthecobacter sp.]|uniref:EamA family transporter n=1 Tax=Prosthecobacter sp. TaxID=1965333 RepID=UPI0025DAD0F4|nr:EamA family transporter [Prosthecobacter sp.]MCF7785277.1 DMT family transporter [Prosthecobacter sp.]